MVLWNKESSFFVRQTLVSDNLQLLDVQLVERKLHQTRCDGNKTCLHYSFLLQDTANPTFIVCFSITLSGIKTLRYISLKANLNSLLLSEKLVCGTSTALDMVSYEIYLSIQQFLVNTRNGDILMKEGMKYSKFLHQHYALE